MLHPDRIEAQHAVGLLLLVMAIALSVCFVDEKFDGAS
jgi:hypothetical protein